MERRWENGTNKLQAWHSVSTIWSAHKHPFSQCSRCLGNGQRNMYVGEGGWKLYIWPLYHLTIALSSKCCPWSFWVAICKHKWIVMIIPRAQNISSYAYCSFSAVIGLIMVTWPPYKIDIGVQYYFPTFIPGAVRFLCSILNLNTWLEMNPCESTTILSLLKTKHIWLNSSMCRVHLEKCRLVVMIF